MGWWRLDRLTNDSLHLAMSHASAFKSLYNILFA